MGDVGIVKGVASLGYASVSVSGMNFEWESGWDGRLD